MAVGEGAPETGTRARRRVRTRAELVAATLVVVAEVGVAGTTIERISRQSAISRGTIYAYFPAGRDELLREAYAELGRALVARTRAATEVAIGWRERLSAHAAEMFALAGEPGLGHFFNVSAPALIGAGNERGIGSGASAAMIEAELGEARRLGEVAPEVDPALTAVMLVGALRESGIRVASGEYPVHHAVAAFARLVSGLAN